MNKEFIPFEQSKILKHDLDYSGESLGWYTINKELYFGKDVRPYEDFNFMYPAPTFSQAFRWFREKYGFTYSIGKTNIAVIHYLGTTQLLQDNDSYEAAELAAIKWFIDVAKQQ